MKRVNRTVDYEVWCIMYKLYNKQVSGIVEVDAWLYFNNSAILGEHIIECLKERIPDLYKIGN